MNACLSELAALLGASPLLTASPSLDLQRAFEFSLWRTHHLQPSDLAHLLLALSLALAMTVTGLVWWIVRRVFASKSKSYTLTIARLHSEIVALQRANTEANNSVQSLQSHLADSQRQRSEERAMMIAARQADVDAAESLQPQLYALSQSLNAERASHSRALEDWQQQLREARERPDELKRESNINKQQQQLSDKHSQRNEQQDKKREADFQSLIKERDGAMKTSKQSERELKEVSENFSKLEESLTRHRTEAKDRELKLQSEIEELKKSLLSKSVNPTAKQLAELAQYTEFSHVAAALDKQNNKLASEMKEIAQPTKQRSQSKKQTDEWKRRVAELEKQLNERIVNEKRQLQQIEELQSQQSIIDHQLQSAHRAEKQLSQSLSQSQQSVKKLESSLDTANNENSQYKQNTVNIEKQLQSLTAANRRVNELEALLAATRSELAQVLNDRSDIDWSLAHHRLEALDHAQSAIDSANHSIAHLQSQLAEREQSSDACTNQRIVELESSWMQSNAALAQRVSESKAEIAQLVSDCHDAQLSAQNATADIVQRQSLIELLQQQVVALTAQIEQLQSDLSQQRRMSDVCNNQRAVELESQLATLKAEMAQLTRGRDDAQAASVHYQSQIEQLQLQLASLTAQLEHQKRLMDDRAAELAAISERRSSVLSAAPFRFDDVQIDKATKLRALSEENESLVIVVDDTTSDVSCSAHQAQKTNPLIDDLTVSNGDHVDITTIINASASDTAILALSVVIQQLLTELDRKYKQINDLQADQHSKDSDIYQLRQESEARIAALKADFDAQSRQASKDSADTAALTASLRELQSEIESLMKSKNELSQSLVQSQRQCQQQVTEISTLSHQLTDATSSIGQLVMSTNELKSLYEVISQSKALCETDLSASRASVTALETSVKEWQSRSESVESSNAQLAFELSQAKSSVTALEASVIELKATNELLALSKTEFEAQLSQSRSAVSQLKTSVQELQSLNATLKLSKDPLESDCIQSQASIEQIRLSMVELEASVSEWKKSSDSLALSKTVLENELSTARDSLCQLESNLTHSKSSIEQLQVIVLELRSSNDMLESDLYNAIKQFQQLQSDSEQQQEPLHSTIAALTEENKQLKLALSECQLSRSKQQISGFMTNQSMRSMKAELKRMSAEWKAKYGDLHNENQKLKDKLAEIEDREQQQRNDIQEAINASVAALEQELSLSVTLSGEEHDGPLPAQPVARRWRFIANTVNETNGHHSLDESADDANASTDLSLNDSMNVDGMLASVCSVNERLQTALQTKAAAAADMPARVSSAPMRPWHSSLARSLEGMTQMRAHVTSVMQRQRRASIASACDFENEVKHGRAQSENVSARPDFLNEALAISGSTAIDIAAHLPELCAQYGSVLEQQRTIKSLEDEVSVLKSANQSLKEMNNNYHHHLIVQEQEHDAMKQSVLELINTARQELHTKTEDVRLLRQQLAEMQNHHQHVAQEQDDQTKNHCDCYHLSPMASPGHSRSQSIISVTSVSETDESRSPTKLSRLERQRQMADRLTRGLGGRICSDPNCRSHKAHMQAQEDASHTHTPVRSHTRNTSRVRERSPHKSMQLHVPSEFSAGRLTPTVRRQARSQSHSRSSSHSHLTVLTSLSPSHSNSYSHTNCDHSPLSTFPGTTGTTDFEVLDLEQCDILIEALLNHFTQNLIIQQRLLALRDRLRTLFEEHNANNRSITLTSFDCGEQSAILASPVKSLLEEENEANIAKIQSLRSELRQLQANNEELRDALKQVYQHQQLHSRQPSSKDSIQSVQLTSSTASLYSSAASYRDETKEADDTHYLPQSSGLLLCDKELHARYLDSLTLIDQLEHKKQQHESMLASYLTELQQKREQLMDQYDRFSDKVRESDKLRTRLDEKQSKLESAGREIAELKSLISSQEDSIAQLDRVKAERQEYKLRFGDVCKKYEERKQQWLQREQQLVSDNAAIERALKEREDEWQTEEKRRELQRRLSATPVLTPVRSAAHTRVSSMNSDGSVRTLGRLNSADSVLSSLQGQVTGLSSPSSSTSRPTTPSSRNRLSSVNQPLTSGGLMFSEPVSESDEPLPPIDEVL